MSHLGIICVLFIGCCAVVFSEVRNSFAEGITVTLFFVIVAVRGVIFP